MKVLVTVEQKDIDRGAQHCGTECPVVWALQRVFGEKAVDRVTRAYIKFADGRMRKLSPEARHFCSTFDCGGPDAVGPFTFSVQL